MINNDKQSKASLPWKFFATELEAVVNPVVRSCLAKLLVGNDVRIGVHSVPEVVKSLERRNQARNGVDVDVVVLDFLDVGAVIHDVTALVPRLKGDPGVTLHKESHSARVLQNLGQHRGIRHRGGKGRQDEAGSRASQLEHVVLRRGAGKPRENSFRGCNSYLH